MVVVQLFVAKGGDERARLLSSLCPSFTIIAASAPPHAILYAHVYLSELRVHEATEKRRLSCCSPRLSSRWNWALSNDASVSTGPIAR